MFEIKCNDIRNMYAQKYRDIAEREISAIAQLAKSENNRLTTEFKIITDKVTEKPTSIDHLDEIREFIAKQGSEIKKLQGQIAECMEIYTILDGFAFQLTKYEQDSKWELKGAPQRLSKIIEEQSQVLEKQKDIMTKDMEREQEEFEDGIEGILGTVNDFHTKNELKRYAEHAADAENYMNKIIQLKAQAS